MEDRERESERERERWKIEELKWRQRNESDIFST